MRLVLLSLAASVASVASVASAAKSCDLVSLVPLLGDERNDACFAASGILFPPPADAAPSPDMWKKTCAVQACASLFDDLRTATPSECAIGKYAAHADLVNQYKTACGLPLDAASSSSSASSQNGTTAQAITSSSAGSSNGARDVNVPDTDVTTPTLATATEQPKRNMSRVVEALTSAAPTTTLASLAGSAVLAVAATLLL